MGGPFVVGERLIQGIVPEGPIGKPSRRELSPLSQCRFDLRGDVELNCRAVPAISVVPEVRPASAAKHVNATRPRDVDKWGNAVQPQVVVRLCQRRWSFRSAVLSMTKAAGCDERPSSNLRKKT